LRLGQKDDSDDDEEPKMLHIKYEFCGLTYESVFKEDEPVLIQVWAEGRVLPSDD
jgi:hypothetical protein